MLGGALQRSSRCSSATAAARLNSSLALNFPLLTIAQIRALGSAYVMHCQRSSDPTHFSCKFATARRKRSCRNATSDPQTCQSAAVENAVSTGGTQSRESTDERLNVVFEAPHQGLQFKAMSAIAGLQMVALGFTADTIFWYAPWSYDTRFAAVYGCVAAGVGILGAITYFRKSYVGQLALVEPHGDSSTQPEAEILTYTLLGRLSQRQKIPLRDIEITGSSGRFFSFKVKNRGGKYLVDTAAGYTPDPSALWRFEQATRAAQ